MWPLLGGQGQMPGGLAGECLTGFGQSIRLHFDQAVHVHRQFDAPPSVHALQFRCVHAGRRRLALVIHHFTSATSPMTNLPISVDISEMKAGVDWMAGVRLTLSLTARTANSPCPACCIRF